jgi:hypothetical protein
MKLHVSVLGHPQHCWRPLRWPDWQQVDPVAQLPDFGPQNCPFFAAVASATIKNKILTIIFLNVMQTYIYKYSDRVFF